MSFYRAKERVLQMTSPLWIGSICCVWSVLKRGDRVSFIIGAEALNFAGLQHILRQPLYRLYVSGISFMRHQTEITSEASWLEELARAR